MMKKHNLLRSQIFLACCLVVGGVQAQINFSGDTIPNGDFGGRHEFNSLMTVGDIDEGTLSITNGAVFNHPARTVIAQEPGSTGVVNISGGAEWNDAGIWVGRSGNAELNIISGGKLTTGHSYIGQFTGNGTVTIDGPGSAWTIPPQKDADFWIGNQAGSATVRVLNGATMSASSDIYSSLHTASSSSIEINGANSTMSAAAFCYLGMSGPTSVNIINGGLLSCGRTTFLGLGNVTLSGSGSKWRVQTDLDIGRSQANSRGILTIGEGSEVTVASDLRLAANNPSSYAGSGTLNIEGSTTPGVLKAQRIIFGPTNLNSININHSSRTYQFSPSISGTGGGNGSVNLRGSGTTVFTGNNTYIGTTSIQAGVLRAGSATALTSQSVYAIGRLGTLDTNNFGLSAITINNAGVLTIGSTNTSATITASQYSGYGGTLHLSAVLAGNTSATQKLLVPGSTRGTTTLNIRNLGGAGAQTTGNGILVVQVGQESNGQFSLPAPGYVQAGAYRYTLVKVGRNWYLQSAPSTAKAASADEQAACTAGDPLAAACTVTPGTGTVAATKPTALTASAADAAAPSDTAAPVAETSAELDGTAHGLDDIKDGEAVRLAEAVPVPGLGAMGMVSLSSLMGIAGLRRSRKSA